MQKPQKRLGKGLDSLISATDATAIGFSAKPLSSPGTSTAMIKIDRIRPNPSQPRKDINHEHLQSLADSIKNTGVIQPIAVRPASGDYYEIIVGQRRWHACQMAGIDEIPAVIRDANDEQMLELALIENIYREDLNAIDRANAYKNYCDEFNLTADEVAKRLGEDRTTVTNYMRLLELPNEAKSMVIDGRLSMGHARCLLAIKSPSDLIRTAKEAIDNLLSVRALEKIVRQRVEARATVSKPTDKTAATKRPQIRNLEEAFTRALGTKVEIQESRRKGQGKITIHYYTLDDFDRISQMISIDTDN